MNLFLSLFLVAGLFTTPDGEHKARQGVFALTNARIETVTNGTIEQGTLVIRNDKIEALGANVTIPADAEVIDCTGLTIYPGLIDSGTRLGTVEISTNPRTVDSSEQGALTPHVKALTAVNPNSVLIPVTRVSGVTTALTEPGGGLFSGVAALINLHGYTPSQMFLGMEGMVMQFPRTGRLGWWDSRPEEEIKKAADEAKQALADVWERAQFYAKVDSATTADGTSSAPEYVPEMEALLPVVRGEMPLILSVNTAPDILKAIDWVQERNIENVIFSGVAEGWRVADKIAEAGIPCLVGPVLSVPTRQSDRYDKAYANAGLLAKAGVQIAIRTGEAENVRNLPFNAGFAAAYGLGREEALRAVTINPAEIFGVSDRIGSLEVGKHANLFVADGDPFETKTSIAHVFIDGYMIPMTNRHVRLYEEFLERDPGLQKHSGN